MPQAYNERFFTLRIWHKCQASIEQLTTAILGQSEVRKKIDKFFTIQNQKIDSFKSTLNYEPPFKKTQNKWKNIKQAKWFKNEITSKINKKLKTDKIDFEN